MKLVEPLFHEIKGTNTTEEQTGNCNTHNHNSIVNYIEKKIAWTKPKVSPVKAWYQISIRMLNWPVIYHQHHTMLVSNTFFFFFYVANTSLSTCLYWRWIQQNHNGTVILFKLQIIASAKITIAHHHSAILTVIPNMHSLHFSPIIDKI